MKKCVYKRNLREMKEVFIDSGELIYGIISSEKFKEVIWAEFQAAQQDAAVSRHDPTNLHTFVVRMIK